MKLIAVIWMLNNSLAALGQGVLVNLQGDTMPDIEKVFPAQKRLVVFVGQASCTGCKDALNKLLTAIDSTQCRIIVVGELAGNVAMMRRTLRSDINNYFTHYDLLLFGSSMPSTKNPSLLLIDEYGKSRTLGYEALFDNIYVRKAARKMISDFLNARDP